MYNPLLFACLSAWFVSLSLCLISFSTCMSVCHVRLFVSVCQVNNGLLAIILTVFFCPVAGQPVLLSQVVCQYVQALRCYLPILCSVHVLQSCSPVCLCYCLPVFLSVCASVCLSVCAAASLKVSQQLTIHPLFNTLHTKSQPELNTYTLYSECQHCISTISSLAI